MLQYLIEVIDGLDFGVELNNDLSSRSCERLRPPETNALFSVSQLHMCRVHEPTGAVKIASCRSEAMTNESLFDPGTCPR